jgi:serine/threonine protein kinase
LHQRNILYRKYNATPHYSLCFCVPLMHYTRLHPTLKFVCAVHLSPFIVGDLKAENVLIDKDGYCILIDLGYAKEVAHFAYTMCGTPLYIAPEIVLSRGYNSAVDYWSFGVLIFEMIHGFSPFYCKVTILLGEKKRFIAC